MTYTFVLAWRTTHIRFFPWLKLLDINFEHVIEKKRSVYTLQIPAWCGCSGEMMGLNQNSRSMHKTQAVFAAMWNPGNRTSTETWIKIFQVNLSHQRGMYCNKDYQHQEHKSVDDMLWLYMRGMVMNLDENVPVWNAQTNCLTWLLSSGQRSASLRVSLSCESFCSVILNLYTWSVGHKHHVARADARTCRLHNRCQNILKRWWVLTKEKPLENVKCHEADHLLRNCVIRHYASPYFLVEQVTCAACKPPKPTVPWFCLHVNIFSVCPHSWRAHLSSWSPGERPNSVDLQSAYLFEPPPLSSTFPAAIFFWLLTSHTLTTGNCQQKTITCLTWLTLPQMSTQTDIAVLVPFIPASLCHGAASWVPPESWSSKCR